VQHDLRLQPQHAQPELLEPLVAAAIGPTPPLVKRAVHFHDEPCGRREEVDDAAGDDDLPAKHDAELLRAQCLPEQALRLRWSLPHGMSARLKKLLTTLLADGGQAASSRPAWGRVQRNRAQDL
jgi:hypothetical protein